MYIHIYIYIYTCMYVCMYACMYAEVREACGTRRDAARRKL